MSETATPASGRELVLSRIFAVSPDRLFRCWTEPQLLKQWFTPPPFETVHADLDVRAGGSTLVVMRGPDGAEFPSQGVYLDVVPNRKIVFTDAYISAWVPSDKPFMTATITFDELGDGRTQYTARVLHWSEVDRKAHEEMGFHEGWGVAAEQMAALAATL